MYLLLAGDTTQLGNVYAVALPRCIFVPSSTPPPLHFCNILRRYAIAFLSVMSLFALGNLMLKFKRNQLKREVLPPPVASILNCG